MNPLGSNWSIRILGKTGSVVKNRQNMDSSKQLCWNKQQKVFINIYCLLKIIEVSKLIERLTRCECNVTLGRTINEHSQLTVFVCFCGLITTIMTKATTQMTMTLIAVWADGRFSIIMMFICSDWDAGVGWVMNGKEKDNSSWWQLVAITMEMISMVGIFIVVVILKTRERRS